MQRTMRIVEVGAVVVGLSVASVAARQIVVSSSEVRIGGGGAGGPLIGGPDMKPITTGTGMILGAVQDAAGRRGVSGAIVTLSVAGFQPAQILADAEGRFAFLSLPPGRFNITATRPGYSDGAYGRTRPSGPTVGLDVAEAERIGDVVVPMWKHAAIAGTVVDENNDPLVGASVRVLRRTTVGGKRQLALGPLDTTDDRGMYRIGSLEPGDYLVVLPMTMTGGSPLDRILGGGGGGGGQVMTFAVSMSGPAGGGGAMSGGDLMTPTDTTTAGVTEDGHLLVFPTQFYPAVATPARATVITLVSGDERPGIDLQLRPVRTARVSGSLSSPDGPAANVQVTVSPAESEDLVSPVGSLTTTTNGSGQFTFSGVPAGAYTVRAQRSSGTRGETISMGGGGSFTMRTITVSGPGAALPNEPTLWAEATLNVTMADITDLAMALRHGLKVSGTVGFTGGLEKPAADRIASIFVTLEPADARAASATSAVRGRVETNGQFTTTGVPPGRYVLRVGNLPQGWSLFGAMLGGHDITDEPVELTGSDASGVVLSLTDQFTEISGVVNAPGTGASDPGAALIAFPTDSSAWIGRGSNPRRIRTVRPGKDGAFTFGNLPPGSYYIGAVPDIMAPDAQDPRFLEMLSRSAARVQLGAGEKKTQNVQTSVAR